MQSTATAPRRSIADTDAAGMAPTPKILARRRINRRNMLIAMCLSYLFDAGLFALYALDGATSFATRFVFVICGVTSTLTFLVLS